MDKHHAAWLERHADRDEAWLTAMLKEGFDVHHLDRTPQGVQHRGKAREQTKPSPPVGKVIVAYFKGLV